HMKYVDGFVLPVPKKNLKAYARMAQQAGKVWRDHGALDYKECVGDDLKVKMGMPFPRTVKLKAGETLVFSYIVYKSRAHRDRVNAKVMKDPRIKDMGDPKNMPFDVKRMNYGGFKVLVDG
ncbi:MAG TPA: DUF1428 domain-containing protein, partial [Nitrospira sp.]|nr:DUF1428 domain-containing protein [Nitrospira sp.]